MKIRGLLMLSTLLMAPLLERAHASAGDDGTQFTVTDKTEVPGKTLKAGTYTIRVVDHLSDRMIVEVDGPGGTQATTFLALPSSKLQAGGSGPITLRAGKGKNALRGFSFPNGTVAEFVYPKAEAVTLAKSNSTTIPAVDPESEGRSASPNLSRGDMQMVTLWMLSPTSVGPDNTPGIAAAKYQTPASAPNSAPGASTQTAARVPAQPVGQPAVSARSQPPVQVASATLPAPRPVRHVRPAAVTALPHTASEEPLLWSMGMLALGAAGMLTGRRIRNERG